MAQCLSPFVGDFASRRPPRYSTYGTPANSREEELVQTCVLLLRHAETTHPNVFNGFESDVGLSPRGLRQALAIAPVLAARSPTAVVSSGMRRALETAGPIAEA